MHAAGKMECVSYQVQIPNRNGGLFDVDGWGVENSLPSSTRLRKLMSRGEISAFRGGCLVAHSFKHSTLIVALVPGLRWTAEAPTCWYGISWKAGGEYLGGCLSVVSRHQGAC